MMRDKERTKSIAGRLTSFFNSVLILHSSLFFGACLIGLLSFICVWAVESAFADLPAQSPRRVRCRMDVRLDAKTHTITGREEVTWINHSGEPVSDLQFHMYLNAFRDRDSTFFKESGGVGRTGTARDPEPNAWGSVEVTSLRLANGSDLTPVMHYIHPDDDNDKDRTVLRVPLPQPVPPQGSVTFTLDFSSKLPRIVARTGYAGDFVFAAQWFPKLGVFEEKGERHAARSGWNCHQFHANTEFFGEYGVYDVSVTVPSHYVFGATGELKAKTDNAGGTTTYRHYQEDVHDFTWTASPHFIKVVRPFRFEEWRDPELEKRLLQVFGPGYTPEQLRLSDVEVTLLVQPNHRHQIDRHFKAAMSAIKYFGYWYGRYPYKTLTVVDPSSDGRAAGGMEYPTLITAGTYFLNPKEVHSPEGVTVHEFGHQYWYGLVGNNEFEEAWLDEGFNSYSTAKVMMAAYPPALVTYDVAGIPMRLAKPPVPGPSLPRLADSSLLSYFRDLPFLNFLRAVPLIPFLSSRRDLKSLPRKDAVLRKGWEYMDRESYRFNSYPRTALNLRTLELYLGEDLMLRVLRTYHEQFRFKHPTQTDFVRTVNDVTGRDMTWFFNELFAAANEMDFAVVSVRSHRAGEDDVKNGGPKKSKSDPNAPYESEVLVQRLGEVRFPVDVLIKFENEAPLVLTWDGQYRWVRYKFTKPNKLEYAQVDPYQKLVLDSDVTNNSKTVEEDRRVARQWYSRFLQWAQHALWFLSTLG